MGKELGAEDLGYGFKATGLWTLVLRGLRLKRFRVSGLRLIGSESFFIFSMFSGFGVVGFRVSAWGQRHMAVTGFRVSGVVGFRLGVHRTILIFATS